MTVPATTVGTRRQRDPERTRREILDVALTEFAVNGYSGARVDEIAARTRTTKRMIYYYFTSKEQLYIAVLERAYSTARDAERQLSDGEHPQARLCGRCLPPAGGANRRAHAHQRILLLPRSQPLHIRRHLRR